MSTPDYQNPSVMEYKRLIEFREVLKKDIETFSKSKRNRYEVIALKKELKKVDILISRLFAALVRKERKLQLPNLA
jgi:hypothetical protein